jgi:F0F1-type ATP synthase delta subunit
MLVYIFLYKAILAENGRLNKLESVLDSFQKIMSAHRGEVTCSVTTAKVRTSTVNSLKIEWVIVVTPS